MHPFEMTREMIDIESITENEKRVGEYLLRYLSGLAASSDGKAETMPVSHERFNVYAEWGTPTVVLSTHMDTVPPFFASYAARRALSDQRRAHREQGCAGIQRDSALRNYGKRKDGALGVSGAGRIRD